MRADRGARHLNALPNNSECWRINDLLLVGRQAEATMLGELAASDLTNAAKLLLTCVPSGDSAPAPPKSVMARSFDHDASAGGANTNPPVAGSLRLPSLMTSPSHVRVSGLDCHKVSGEVSTALHSSESEALTSRVNGVPPC